jgi:Fe-S-cluster-containing dehydrogenase component
MHCIDPACVGACMMGSYQKREYGIITWDPAKCIGCRYCSVVCPFNIPKMQWDTPTPKIVKCEMCNHLLAEGKIPACCDVCPREAVIYGKYTDLLEDAKQRLADYPDRYVNKIYGEKELGGTQVLYLSHVPFEDIGFDLDDEEAVPHLQQSVHHGIYQGFITPVVLYAILGGVMWRNKRKEEKEGQG